MSSVFVTCRAPAASNYSANVGLVVNLTGAGQEATLATTTADTAAADLPYGIIVWAANEVGGAMTVCTHGPCKARAGDTITRGTHTLLMTAADSRLDPCTDGNFYVARYIGMNSAVDGDWIDVFVQPGNYENT